MVPARRQPQKEAGATLAKSKRWQLGFRKCFRGLERSPPSALPDLPDTAFEQKLRSCFSGVSGNRVR